VVGVVTLRGTMASIDTISSNRGSTPTNLLDGFRMID
jgi:hypothetical protein